MVKYFIYILYNCLIDKKNYVTIYRILVKKINRYQYKLTNKKFIARFQWMEKEAIANDKALQNMTLQEMDVLWNLAKKKLSN